MAWSDDIARRGGKALVPACGQGRDAVFLALMGLEVTAIDLSPVGLERTQALAKRHGVSVNTVEADLVEMDWTENQYDTIASIFAHLPQEHRADFHRNLVRALKPGGQILLEGFRAAQIHLQKEHNSGGPHDPTMLFNVQEIKTDFENALEVAFWPGTEILNEGPYHTGLAAVLRAVYSKQELDG